VRPPAVHRPVAVRPPAVHHPAAEPPPVHVTQKGQDGGPPMMRPQTMSVRAPSAVPGTTRRPRGSRRTSYGVSSQRAMPDTMAAARMEGT